MNLFFVHTPFQMLVAQNIIVSENLQNNRLVLSYTSDATSHFYAVYDTLIVTELWSEVIRINRLNVIGSLTSSLYRSYRDIKGFLHRIGDIIRKNDVKHLYMGDINHFSYILLAEKFSDVVKINFFEEGLSHYLTTVNKKKYQASVSIKLKSRMADWFIFNRVGVSNFSRYVYATRDCDFRFAIHRKYTVFKIKTDPFDYYLKFNIVESLALKKVLDNEFKRIALLTSVKSVLFLSTTATSVFEHPVNDELRALETFFSTFEGRYVVLLKYHPKDSAGKKEILKDFFIRKSISFYEVFDGEALPVEVIFSKIRIDVVLSYLSSSMLYAHAIAPSATVVSLLPTILQHYSKAGIESQRLSEMWGKFNELQSKLVREIK